MKYYIEYARSVDAAYPTDFEVVSTKTKRLLERLPWIKIFRIRKYPIKGRSAVI